MKSLGFLWCAITAVVMVWCLAGAAEAADWPQQAKLTAGDGAAEDRFGTVSLRGNYALVGAFLADDNGEDSGSAYVFHREGTTWSQQAKLTAADGAAEDMFGASISLSGDYALVGAYRDDDKGDLSGSAYVFHRDGTTWSQQVKLTPADGAADDIFGGAVSLEGDYALVAARDDDDNGFNSGSAYVFHRDGTSWSQQAKLTADDGAAYDYFGSSISLSGDYALVGARGDDENGDNSGSAYVFHRDGTTWSQEGKLTAADGTVQDSFGYSVSLSGDYALVGAYGDDDDGEYSGSAYLFHRDGTTWSHQAKLTASDGAEWEWFGSSVSLSADHALVGAKFDDDKGYRSGSAYVFHRDGTTWSQEGKLTAADGAAEDMFGACLSLDGTYALVGALLDDDNGTDSGSVYVFVPEPSSVVLLGLGAVGLLACAWWRKR